MKTNKQTPTQIATQSMKGCNKKQGRGLHFYICGDLLMNVLCPSCKSKILAYRTAWENELGEWKDVEKYSNSVDAIFEITNKLRKGIHHTYCDCSECNQIRCYLDHLAGVISRYGRVDDRISELTSALKILEGEQK